jgi:non-ribosomal peptide synthetase component F
MDSVNCPPVADCSLPNAVWLDDAALLYRLPTSGIDHGAIVHLLSHDGLAASPLPDRAGARVDAPVACTPDQCSTQTLQRRFELYAQTNPGVPAVKSGSTMLTYGELDAQADAIAVLLQQRGFGPDSICIIDMQPSINMVRAMLGALKAGGAFSFDGAAPHGPHDHVMGCDDAGDDLPFAWPDEYPTYQSSPACRMSAPQPSGDAGAVYLSHTALVERLLSMQCLCPIGQGDAVLQNRHGTHSSLAWEIMWPLSQGAKLLLPSAQEISDAGSMRALIKREHVSVMHADTCALRLLADPTDTSQLRSLRGLFCTCLTAQPNYSPD